MDFDNIHKSKDKVDHFAEEFVMGRLADAERLRYEEHVLECAVCQPAVERVLELVKLLRNAQESESSE